MQITTVGLDLAKNIFQVHGITSDGTVAFKRSLRRAQLLVFSRSWTVPHWHGGLWVPLGQPN